MRSSLVMQKRSQTGGDSILCTGAGVYGGRWGGCGGGYQFVGEMYGADKSEGLEVTRAVHMTSDQVMLVTRLIRVTFVMSDPRTPLY